MAPADTTLTITTEQDPYAAGSRCQVQCAHGITTVTLPPSPTTAAARAATTLAVLQHYRTTGCDCTRRSRHR